MTLFGPHCRHITPSYKRCHLFWWHDHQRCWPKHSSVVVVLFGTDFYLSVKDSMSNIFRRSMLNSWLDAPGMAKKTRKCPEKAIDFRQANWQTFTLGSFLREFDPRWREALWFVSVRFKIDHPTTETHQHNKICKLITVVTCWNTGPSCTKHTRVNHYLYHN